MQVFLPYPDDLVKSAQSLDDLRLNKQITEINQILLTYVNGSGGHSEHPVNKWYRTENGIAFLCEYSSYLCGEYYYRFKKHHMGEYTNFGLCEELNVDDEICYIKPVYIKGQRNKDQIITTENVDELYQKLLCDKWDNDKVAPKWTNRDTPEFYHKELNNNG